MADCAARVQECITRGGLACSQHYVTHGPGRPLHISCACVLGRMLRPLKTYNQVVGGRWTTTTTTQQRDLCVVWLAHVCGACSSCVHALSQVVCVSLGYMRCGCVRVRGGWSVLHPSAARHMSRGAVLCVAGTPTHPGAGLFDCTACPLCTGHCAWCARENVLSTAVHVHVWLLLTQRRARRRAAALLQLCPGVRARHALCCCCRWG